MPPSVLVLASLFSLPLTRGASGFRVANLPELYVLAVGRRTSSMVLGHCQQEVIHRGRSWFSQNQAREVKIALARNLLSLASKFRLLESSLTLKIYFRLQLSFQKTIAQDATYNLDWNNATDPTSRLGWFESEISSAWNRSKSLVESFTCQ